MEFIYILTAVLLFFIIVLLKWLINLTEDNFDLKVKVEELNIINDQLCKENLELMDRVLEKNE